MSEISPDRLSRLLRERGPALVLYARQWCRNPEDVVQEAFLQLVRESTAPEDEIPWLYRVVRHRALNAARSATRRARHESAMASQNESWFVRTGAEQQAIVDASEALRQLPVDQREVIIARLWGGLSLQEVADLVGSSLSTAYRRYLAGIETLRDRLGAPCTQAKTNTEP